MFDDTLSLPEFLEQMPPGVDLHRVLASVKQSRLDGYDRLVVAKAFRRLISHLEAGYYAAVYGVAEAQADFYGFEGYELAAAEVGAAFRMTRRRADTEMGLVFNLVDRFPRVWEALHSGRIDLARAKSITYTLEAVPEELATRVVEQVISRAPDLTTGQLSARIRRLVFELDPETARKVYLERVSDRRVELGANPDGTASLYGLNLPADRANKAMERIDVLARLARNGCDPRNIDQVRADVFLDLLEGRGNHGSANRRPVIDIHVDLTTLAGLDDRPGEIPGFGPVIADIARQVAAEQEQGEWRFTVTDRSQVVANGITRRRPTAALRRYVEARHPTCVFPGCRRPAINSDIDHRSEWAKGGKTEEDNLEPLCRFHHRLRHEGGWHVERKSIGKYSWEYVWTSPLGHKYTVQPQGP